MLIGSDNCNWIGNEIGNLIVFRKIATNCSLILLHFNSATNCNQIRTKPVYDTISDILWLQIFCLTIEENATHIMGIFIPPFSVHSPIYYHPKSKTSLFVFQSQEIHDDEEEKVEGLPPSSEIALVDKYVPIRIL